MGVQLSCTCILQVSLKSEVEIIIYYSTATRPQIEDKEDCNLYFIFRFFTINKMSAIAKPQLRGLFTSQVKKHIIVATILSVAGACGYEFGVLAPKKALYAEFYKTYDADKDYKRMAALGVFHERMED